MKKHYETHVEDTDKLISVAGPVLDYKSWYEQYRKLMEEQAQNVYLYNTANGLLISINNPRSLQSFGTKSLHAICSDGRLYDRNWVEYEYTVDQNFEIVKSSLNIGFNLNNYTQIAFKNLGIYNNQLLSKDDCIKAYNYLQTLKAK